MTLLAITLLLLGAVSLLCLIVDRLRAEGADPVDDHMASAALDPSSDLVRQIETYLRAVVDGPPVVPGRDGGELS